MHDYYLDHMANNVLHHLRFLQEFMKGYMLWTVALVNATNDCTQLTLLYSYTWA